MIRRPWTKGEDALMRREYPRKRTDAIAEKLGRSVRAIYMRADTLGLSKSVAYIASVDSGRLSKLVPRGAAYRFKPGQRPWNAGISWNAGGRSTETRFKAGQLNGRAAAHAQPVGSLRITKNGYLERKYSAASGGQTERWRTVHRLVWEAEHGPTPPGHAVIFKPGRFTTDPERITVDGLELVSRAELMRRNSVHNRYPKEVALLVQLRGALNRQINKRARLE